MIKLEVIDDEGQQFLVSGDEPFRVEVLEVDGSVVAHVYGGAAVALHQEPVGMYDGTLRGDGTGNQGWEKS